MLFGVIAELREDVDCSFFDLPFRCMRDFVRFCCEIPLVYGLAFLFLLFLS